MWHVHWVWLCYTVVMDDAAEAWRTGWLGDRPPETVVGDGLVLDRVAHGHLDAVVTAVQSSLAELHAFMPWATMDYGRDDAEFFVQDSVAAWEERRSFTYVISANDHTDGISGTTGLMNRVRPGTLEIGYWVTTAHTGRRIARRSSSLLIDVCRGLVGVDTLEIHHDEANLASRSVPVSLGFGERGVKDVEVQAPGKTGRLVVWALDL